MGRESAKNGALSNCLHLGARGHLWWRARPHDLRLPKRKEADSSPHEPDHPNKALVYFGALFVMTS